MSRNGSCSFDLSAALHSAYQAQSWALENYLRYACRVLDLTPEQLARQYTLEEYPEITQFNLGEIPEKFTLSFRCRLVRKQS